MEKGSLITRSIKLNSRLLFSVSWHKTKYSMGVWDLFGTGKESCTKALLKPDKQVYFCREHLTYLNAWMAGALESARSVVRIGHSRLRVRPFNILRPMNADAPPMNAGFINT